MHPGLSAFFQEVPRFLAGEQSAADLEAALGSSPSGTEALGFYRTLMERNAFKLLREIFPGVRALLVAQDPDLWTRLVLDFSRKHPCGHWNPNLFGEPFSDFLREAGDAVHPAAAEVADYHYIQYLVSAAQRRPDDDGWDRTIFIRQYTHAVSAYVAGLGQGPGPDEPPEPKPTIVLVYRGLHSEQVHWLHPTPPQLAAVARRRGLPLPPALRELPPKIVDDAAAQLVDYGLFAAEPTGAG